MMNEIPERVKKDFLTLRDYSAQEIRTILEISRDVKEHPDKYVDALKRKELALIFQKTSTRTRVSFEVAIHQLGGNSIYLDWRTTNYTLGGLKDETRCISEYVDIIMARVYEHEIIEKIADASLVPVINGLSDSFHPCQALADIFTMEETYKDLSDRKITFIGDGSNNVAASLINICVKLGYHLTIVAPPQYMPDRNTVEWIKNQGAEDLIEITSDTYEGVKGSDVLYTDTFVSMGQESEMEKRLRVFEPYQLNSKIVEATGKKPIIMHCLPAHREIEITSEVLDSDISVVFRQAQNRLHTQKGLLLYLLKYSKYRANPL